MYQVEGRQGEKGGREREEREEGGEGGGREGGINFSHSPSLQKKIEVSGHFLMKSCNRNIMDGAPLKKLFKGVRLRGVVPTSS